MVNLLYFLVVEEQLLYVNKIYILDDEVKLVGECEFKCDIEVYVVFKKVGGVFIGLVQEIELMSLLVWVLDEEVDVEY